MTSFSESNFVKKLADLNNTQQSIQTLSLWLIHHRKHAKTVVHVWNKEIRKAFGPRKLTFLYLANDVIQNSKKKGSEYTVAFESSLSKAFGHAYRDADEKMKGSIQRLLTIWRERNVYNKNILRHIKRALTRKERDPSPKVPEPQSSTSATAKKKQTEKASLSDEIKLVEVGQAPDLDTLSKVVSELENAASGDAAVREKIAALPPEVSDISYLDKISDKLEAESFSATVEDACTLLKEYNTRLTQELLDRRNLAIMIRDFLAGQKDQQVIDEKLLKDLRIKQEKTNNIRDEIQSHIKNLPEIPTVVENLGPLPSAGDLFNQ